MNDSVNDMYLVLYFLELRHVRIETAPRVRSLRTRPEGKHIDQGN